MSTSTGKAHRRLRGTLLLALVCGECLAQADRLEEVLVSGDRSATRRSLPTRIVGPGPGGYLDAGAHLLPDALRDEPGLFLQQTTPGQAAVIVRGLRGSQVLHLIDGIRVNDALFRSAPTQYFSLIDPFVAARVDVIRTSGSALYGADAIGGVINVETSRPRPPDSSWGVGGQAVVSASSADQARVAHVRLDTGGEAPSMRLGLSHQDVGQRRVGGDEKLAHTDYRSRAASLKLVLAPSPASEWVLDLQHLEQPGTPRYDELVQGFGQTTPSSEVYRFEPNERKFVHALRRGTSDSAFINRYGYDFAYQRIVDDRRSRDTGSTIELRERNRSSLYGATFFLESRRLERHALRFGGQLYADDVASRRLATDIAVGGALPAPSRFPDGSEMDSADLYVYDEWLAATRVSIDLGVRLSRHEVRLPARSGSDAFAKSFNDVTGHIGAEWRIETGLSALASVSQGFRPPNVFDLATLGPRPGNRYNIPSEDLRSEQSWTLDVGLRKSAQVFARRFSRFMRRRTVRSRPSPPARSLQMAGTSTRSAIWRRCATGDSKPQQSCHCSPTASECTSASPERSARSGTDRGRLLRPIACHRPTASSAQAMCSATPGTSRASTGSPMSSAA